MMLWIIPSLTVNAVDEPSVAVEKMSEDEMYDLLKTSENKPAGLLEKLTLRESDVPDYMKNTNLKETNAVMRLEDKEDDLSSVKYLNRDGTVSEFIFSENVKYEKDGKAYDKTNRLELNGAKGFYNPDNDVRTEYPLNYGKDHGVKLELEGRVIEVIPQTEKTADSLSALPKKHTDENGDYVVYKDVFAKGVDVEYHTTFSGMKENVILNSKPESGSFAFTVKTNGLTLGEDAVLYDEKGEPVVSIGELIIYDADGKEGKGTMQFTAVEPGSEYAYTVTVDEEFLEDENTVYPVTVDPTYSDITASDVRGITVKSNTTNVTTSASAFTVGKMVNSNSYCRAFLKSNSFKNVIQNHNSSDFQSVYLYLYISYVETSGNSSFVKISPCSVKENWSVVSPVSSTLYTNIGENKGINYIYSSKVNSFQHINLKTLVNYLKSNGTETELNSGFVLKLTDESQSAAVKFLSKNYSNSQLRPYIYITFKSNTTAGNMFDTKGLYKVRNTNDMSKYLVKTSPSTGTYQLSYTNDSIPAGSTETKSPFLTFHKIADSEYTISFISSKEEGKRLFLKYMGGQSNSLSLVKMSGFPDEDEMIYYSWYVIYNSTFAYYTFVNVAWGYYRLTINGSQYSSQDKWSITKVGLDVPIHKQIDPDACGPSCGLEIVNFFTQYDIDEVDFIDTLYALADEANQPRDKTNHVRIYSTINYYVQNTISNIDYDTISPSGTQPYDYYNINEYDNILKNQIDHNRPVILQIKLNSSNNEFGYATPEGHYTLIKGWFVQNGVTYGIVNDSFNGEELIVSFANLKTYNQNLAGYIIRDASCDN